MLPQWGLQFFRLKLSWGVLLHAPSQAFVMRYRLSCSLALPLDFLLNTKSPCMSRFPFSEIKWYTMCENMCSIKAHSLPPSVFTAQIPVLERTWPKNQDEQDTDILGVEEEHHKQRPGPGDIRLCTRNSERAVSVAWRPCRWWEWKRWFEARSQRLLFTWERFQIAKLPIRWVQICH